MYALQLNTDEEKEVDAILSKVDAASATKKQAQDAIHTLARLPFAHKIPMGLSSKMRIKYIKVIDLTKLSPADSFNRVANSFMIESED